MARNEKPDWLIDYRGQVSRTRVFIEQALGKEWMDENDPDRERPIDELMPLFTQAAMHIEFGGLQFVCGG